MFSMCALFLQETNQLNMNRFFLLPLLSLILLSSACNKECDDDLEWNKQIAVAYVHSYATSIGEAVIDMADDSTRIQYIRRAIHQIRFYPDSSGYLFVYDCDGINIAHEGQPNLEGQNLWDHQDIHGKYVVREFTATALSGGGFVEYYWIKPGETEERQKLGYVEPVPNTNYWIGGGVYLE